MLLFSVFLFAANMELLRIKRYHSSAGKLKLDKKNL
jgi:hypothetical protein